MENFNWSFDATQVAPSQGGRRHPVGNKWKARITDASIEKVKDKNSGRLEVEFTTEVGTITKNYNLWNESAAAVEIANKEFSALCHAVSIFKVQSVNGKIPMLINGQCMIDVSFQKGQEPSAEKPEGGYVEVSKVYDVNGNEPGKGPAPQQQSSGFGGAPQQQSSNPNQAGFQQQPQQQPQWNNNPQPSQPQPQWNTSPPQGSGAAPGPQAQQGWPQTGPTGPAPSGPQGGWQQGANQSPNAPWAPKQ